MHTHFSLRYGILSPEGYLQEMQTNGYQTARLTDVNNTSATLDFVRLAPKHKIKPVVGVDFRNGAERCYVALAKNNAGFKAINEHLSAYSHAKENFHHRAPYMPYTYIIYPVSLAKEVDITTLRKNEFLGVTPADLQQLRLASSQLKNFDRLVALPTFTFRDKRDFNTHRLLRAIDNNTLLSKLSKTEEGNPNDVFCTRDELIEKYAEQPELLSRYEELLASCSFEFKFGTEHPHKNQKTYAGSEEADFKLIKKLVKDGLPYRYPKPTQELYDRLDKELSIVKEKSFLSYFLINWDITSYARSKGYFYVGRGSGANSVVAYILRITDVDPIELDLYFERFINLYRQNPPDFDIDFSWTDRDDVTRYIFERFDNVCLLGAYNTFQYRAVVRELGKVFGLPKHEIDLLASGRFNVRELDHLSVLVLKYSERIQNFPNHISIHSAGILISQEPIHSYTATFLPPKGYPTTHFDMVVAEDAGLYKFDILSQRGLGKIKDTLEIVKYNQPEAPEIDIHDMPRFKKDERIKHLLRTAQAIGCFYVESPAMRMLMRKLLVDDYLGLVAASSVIRPGVAKSGMMKEYILRFRFPERRKEAHPIMLNIMPETYGVMVYQEDVIKVAHYFAKLTLGEADVLRRGMSGKFRSREEFNRAKEKFFSNCREAGHSEALTTEIWRQTESFAGYAFAKGHSASYAVESYQSLFLKAYYPLEYMVATINNFGGFYRTELYVHEARMHGAQVEEPCVNRGGPETVIYGKIIVLGFELVKDLEYRAIAQLMAERKENGLFKSLIEFVDRVHISLEQLTLLIRCNAFKFSGIAKKELLWDAHLLLGHAPKRKPTQTLFLPNPKTYTLPSLYTAAFEDAFDQLELFGFPLCSPFSLLREAPKNCLLAKELPQHVGKKVALSGYLITAKMTSTSNRKKMFFGTFIDQEGAWLDSVHFPEIAERYPFRGRGIYRVEGKVTEEFGCYAIEATYMEKLSIIEDPRYADAKAFTKALNQKKHEEKSNARWEEHR